jgi:hypothetical protein
MPKRFYFILYVCIIGLLFTGPSIHLVWGETHVQSSMETRTFVALQVEKTELQKWVGVVSTFHHSSVSIALGQKSELSTNRIFLTLKAY